MADALFQALSFLSAFVGMSWLALAMKPHWAQVRSAAPHHEALARRLRWFGTTSLLLSLAIGLALDHASMACLVWIMTLSASALLVALALAFAPGALSWLARVAAVS